MFVSVLTTRSALNHRLRFALAIGLKCIPLASALLAMSANASIAQNQRTQSSGALERSLGSAGARDIHVEQLRDGGFTINGTIKRKAFALAIPANWNRKALLYAHGYSFPGTSVAVSRNPMHNEASELMKAAYSQGFAVGHSAYDKAGVDIKGGATNTLGLRSVLVSAGIKKIYLSGASMGGAVVISLIEQHPGMFVGAISACGITNSTQRQFGDMVDVRAVYDFYTRGTPYELPGGKDLRTSAMSMVSPSSLDTVTTAFQLLRARAISNPLVKLFKDAGNDPKGDAAGIIRKISSVARIDPDPASFAAPLFVATLGMDDIIATYGGRPYDNRKYRYTAPELTRKETEALNRNIARIKGDPVAVANAKRWHEASGRFATPLVVIHGKKDSLVRYSQFESFLRTVRASGNQRNLVAATPLPPAKEAIPLTGIYGYAHCGFTPEQLANAWNTLLTRAH
ncbi:alpha/beta hydrolase family protein [Phyllobacterium sp. TAF24]|uniref:alpha/beta hydrolase family protein n=1 Tax=Phyllobacterium sp. TAF24 TaxID=3233068 RepID=UPI003F99DECE